MHVVLWRFRVRPGRDAEFEAAYGDDGTWVRFFRTGAGFLGSELLRGSDGTYLTIDRWDSIASLRAFRDANARHYAELDAACEAMTLEEALIAEVEA